MISASKLKVRELTPIEKEELLKFMSIKRKGLNWLISITLFFVFTLNMLRYFFVEDRPSIFTIIVFYIILIIISFLPVFISFVKNRIRIHKIKINDVSGVKAMCPYGKYDGHYRPKVNGSRVYEIITEFESRKVIEPTVYGSFIRAQDNFYVIRFGKKDTVFCNFDIEEE